MVLYWSSYVVKVLGKGSEQVQVGGLLCPLPQVMHLPLTQSCMGLTNQGAGRAYSGKKAPCRGW